MAEIRSPNLPTGGDGLSDDESHIPHKPADDTEQIYFEGSPMLRGLMGKEIGWPLAGLVLIAIPIVIRVMHWSHVPWWLTLGLVVAGILLFFVPAIKAKTIRYRISNYRIDFERGLIGRDIDTLELWHVEDIHFHQSIIDRILGVGTITVLSHDDTTPRLVLRALPNPKPLFEALKQRIIAVKRQRGVVKMDTGT